MIRAFVLGLALFLCLSCNRKSGLVFSENPSGPERVPGFKSAKIDPIKFKDDWSKRVWINKVATRLRNGAGLTKKDNIEELMKLSSVEIVDQFMRDPRFIEMALDFNMYFLGAKVDRVVEKRAVRQSDGQTKYELAYSFMAYEYPAAMTSARELAKNGDYLSLLSGRQPLYVQPIYPRFDQNNKEILLDEELAKVGQLIDEVLAHLDEKEVDIKKVCDKAQIIGLNFINIFGNDSLFGNYLTFAKTNPLYVITEECFTRQFSRFTPAIKELKEKLPALTQTIKSLKYPQYNPSNLTEIKSAFFPALYEEPEDAPFRFLFWARNPNSSTNRDRKRAAYALKTYFCDDLTPLNVVIPEEHTGGRHGDEPSCYACHYKLDPMAGFFRNRGLLGHDYSDSNFLVFDDAAFTNRETYLQDWKFPNAQPRQWNVGYIRTTQYPEYNIYGESLDDLFRIIRTAPEPKYCVVKRLVQYMTTDKQVVDQGFLRMLQEDFVKSAAINSSEAFKQSIRRITHTNLFANPNPKHDECYDYVPGEDPSTKPPCRVSYLLEQNCATCHRGASASGRLDLTKWITTPSGRKGFEHKNRRGEQIDPLVTFAAIAESLVDPDPEIRMPLKKYITAADQKEIYLWAESMGKAK